MLKFLKSAQEFALNKGDDDWFCEVYTRYRERLDIDDSTWFALSYLYGNEVANEIQSKHSSKHYS
jgi:hypothetical protein